MVTSHRTGEKHGWFWTSPIRERGQRRIHSRTTAREIIDDFGTKLDYWVTGYGTGGTLKGVAGCSPRKPGHQDRRLRAGGRAAADKWRAAGAQRRRDARGRASRLEAAPDAGLDPGFHPQAHRRRGRPGRIDKILRSPGPTRMRCSQDWRERGIFVGITSGATFAGALEVAPTRRRARTSSACCRTPANATLDAFVRGRPGRHDGGGAHDLPLDPARRRGGRGELAWPRTASPSSSAFGRTPPGRRRWPWPARPTRRRWSSGGRSPSPPATSGWSTTAPPRSRRWTRRPWSRQGARSCQGQRVGGCAGDGGVIPRAQGAPVRGAVVPTAGLKLPERIEDIVRVHARMHAAEGELDRDIVADACAGLGLKVHRAIERELFGSPRTASGPPKPRSGHACRPWAPPLGPPWSEDQKLAMLAALVHLESGGRIRMTKPLEEQVALVAGATRAAGRGIAIELAAAGAKVYCTGRSTRGTPATPGRPETIEETAGNDCRERRRRGRRPRRPSGRGRGRGACPGASAPTRDGSTCWSTTSGAATRPSTGARSSGRSTWRRARRGGRPGRVQPLDHLPTPGADDGRGEARADRGDHRRVAERLPRPAALRPGQGLGDPPRLRHGLDPGQPASRRWPCRPDSRAWKPSWKGSG